MFALVRSLVAAARSADGRVPEEAVNVVVESISTQSGLCDRERAIVAFVLRLTWTPGLCTSADHIPLRAVGLDDRAIHDVVQVVACFSFMNRLADGTGVTLLPARYDLATTLFGADALEEHLAWGGARRAEAGSRPPPLL